MRMGSMFLLALAAQAQSGPDPTDVLARARGIILERIERLPNYTCVQTINRNYFKTPALLRIPRSCDQLIGARKTKPPKLEIEATDRLRLDVKVSEGREIGAWAGAGKFESRSIIEIVGNRPFGTGPFGTLLSDIFSNLGASFRYMGPDGASLFEYRFDVPIDSSHYLIRAGHDWQPTAYDGGVWIDPLSFEVKRLQVRTGELSPETQSCEATTTVDYEVMKVGSGATLIPRISVLNFLMRDGSETESTTTYSSCHEFHSESTIHFQDMPEISAKEPKAAETRGVPAGLTVVLRLETPIDTDTAAAGDVIEAKVEGPVLFGKSKDVAIPAGALVRARLTLMQHWLGRSARFEIAMFLESIEMNGATIPFYAKLDRSEEVKNVRRALSAGLQQRGMNIWLPPPGQSAMVGMFVFPTKKGHYVVPRGYEFHWLTLPPPSRNLQ